MDHLKQKNRMSSEVTTYNPQATLIEMRRDVKRFPRIKSVPMEIAIPEMNRIVSQAFLYMGKAAEPSDIQLIASSLLDELLEENPYGTNNLTFGELRVIIKRAVLNTELYGISIANLYRVVIEYCKGEGHIIQKQLEAEAEKARREIKSTAADVMLKAYAGGFAKSNKVK